MASGVCVTFSADREQRTLVAEAADRAKRRRPVENAVIMVGRGREGQLAHSASVRPMVAPVEGKIRAAKRALATVELRSGSTGLAGIEIEGGNSSAPGVGRSAVNSSLQVSALGA